MQFEPRSIGIGRRHDDHSSECVRPSISPHQGAGRACVIATCRCFRWIETGRPIVNVPACRIMVTLLSLASRQIWPQVLSVLHVKPERLVLLHSTEEAESKRPAERLKNFLEGSGLLKQGNVALSQIPHDSFSGVREAIADFAADHSLDESNCLMNLTGGNKLMAMAAAEWCRLSPTKCFYLERDLRFFPFNPINTDLLPQPEFKLDPHLAKDLDPLALLRCQIDAAEIVSGGQSLTLNPAGHAGKDVEVQALLKKSFDFRKYLKSDVDEHESRVGDGLEYATAYAVLKLGVPRIQRGIRLSPRFLRAINHEEGELDLVFNWAGKLWVVDCKDRKDAGNRVERLRTEIISQSTLTTHMDQLLKGLTWKGMQRTREEKTVRVWLDEQGEK